MWLLQLKITQIFLQNSVFSALHVEMGCFGHKLCMNERNQMLSAELL